MESRASDSSSGASISRALEGASMKILFKITSKLLTAVRADLVRPHEFAAERVGFLSCRFGALSNGGFVINRLVGATVDDVRNREWKTVIAARSIGHLNPDARVVQVRQRWQQQATLIRDCDILIGCVDTFSERDQLERQARR